MGTTIDGAAGDGAAGGYAGIWACAISVVRAPPWSDIGACAKAEAPNYTDIEPTIQISEVMI